jgi:hypothetical protein
MDYVVNALYNAEGGTWKAYRTRMESFNAEELPAFNVIPDKGETEYLSTDEITRRFRFTVRHMAAAVNSVDLTVDDLYLAAAQVILIDPTLGGLVRYTREISQEWKLEKGEYDSVALEVIYEVEFATRRNDPTISVP